MSGKKLRRGFTLTEFLIVIGLVVILSAIALVNLYPKNSRERFNSTVLKLVTIFNEAVSNSITAKDIPVGLSYSASTWRVYLMPKGCSDGPWFSLVLYNGFEDFVYSKQYLPEGVDFDRAFTFPQATSTCPSNKVPKKIYFTKETGIPTISSDPRAKIYLVNNPSISSTISVSTVTGQVIYTSDENLGI